MKAPTPDLKSAHGFRGSSKMEYGLIHNEDYGTKNGGAGEISSRSRQFQRQQFKRNILKQDEKSKQLTNNKSAVLNLAKADKTVGLNLLTPSYRYNQSTGKLQQQ